MRRACKDVRCAAVSAQKQRASCHARGMEHPPTGVASSSVRHATLSAWSTHPRVWPVAARVMPRLRQRAATRGWARLLLTEAVQRGRRCALCEVERSCTASKMHNLQLQSRSVAVARGTGLTGCKCMGWSCGRAASEWESGGRAGSAHCVTAHFTGSRGCGFGAMLRLLLRRRQEMMSLLCVRAASLMGG